MGSESPLRSEIRRLEEALLRPEIRTSSAELSRLLGEDFIEFGSSGRVYGRAQVIEALQAASSDRITLESFRLQELGEHAVLARYVAVRHDGSGLELTRSLRSSIWKREEGQWRIVFHQGTIASPDDNPIL